MKGVKLRYGVVCLTAFLAGFFAAAGVAVFGLLAAHL